MINFEMYHDIIEALSAALDAKDVYTAGHSTRVGNMACDLGEKLNLDNSNLQMIHIAGHLHDIGKIGVSMYDPKITDCIIENWNTIVVPYYL